MHPLLAAYITCDPCNRGRIFRLIIGKARNLPIPDLWWLVQETTCSSDRAYWFNMMCRRKDYDVSM